MTALMKGSDCVYFIIALNVTCNSLRWPKNNLDVLRSEECNVMFWQFSCCHKHACDHVFSLVLVCAGDTEMPACVLNVMSFLDCTCPGSKFVVHPGPKAWPDSQRF